MSETTVEEQLRVRARDVAAAAGEPTVLFGVRAHSDTVFACCGDVEVDASTFAGALDGVVSELKRRATADAAAARRTLQRTDAVDAL